MAVDDVDTITVNKADGSYQRAQQTFTFAATTGVPGTGAGYVVTGLDTALVTLPASTGASMLLIPINGLKVGDVITAWQLNAQLESGGNNNVLDGDLRVMTVVAAGSSDASLGAITQVVATADTAVASSKTLAAAHTVAKGEVFYVLVTGTTLAATDQEILSVDVTVNQR